VVYENASRVATKELLQERSFPRVRHISRTVSGEPKFDSPGPGVCKATIVASFFLKQTPQKKAVRIFKEISGTLQYGENS
jgi:hypothetical protein